MERSRLLFNDLQELTLLLSCLCHDVDHTGHNNAFEKASESELFKRTKDGKSVSEPSETQSSNLG